MARGYDTDYAAQRAALMATVTPATRCALCGQLARPRDPWQADHVVPVSRGGAGGPLQIAHRSCNQAKAGAAAVPYGSGADLGLVEEPRSRRRHW